MTATTRRDLDAALARVARSLRAAGAPSVELLHLQHGSPSAGTAFRLYLRDPHHGGLRTVPGMSSSGYLGATRREAFDALHLLAAGLDMAAAARGTFPAARSTYVVGLPVVLTVHVDGTVSAEVDLSEAGDLDSSTSAPEDQDPSTLDDDRTLIDQAVAASAVRVS